MSASNTNDQKGQVKLSENMDTFVVLAKRFVPLLVVLALVLFLWLFFKYGCENAKPLVPISTEVNEATVTDSIMDTAVAEEAH